jgi:hypothetical protein
MHKSIDYFEQYDKHLIIFDFDETLCHNPDAKVYIKNKESERIKEMTPTEYSKWRSTGEYEQNPKKWDMDFREYRTYPREGKTIAKTVEKLKHYCSQDHYVVALVTGRDNLVGPKKWMRDCRIPVNKITLMCSGSPDKKNCYRSLVNTFEPKHVTVYEDSVEYIRQCEEICEVFKIPFSGVLIENQEEIINWRKND